MDNVNVNAPANTAAPAEARESQKAFRPRRKKKVCVFCA